MRFLVPIIFALPFCWTASGERILRQDNGHLEWLVYLPGSSVAHFAAESSPWMTTFLSEHSFNLLVINKLGGGENYNIAEFNRGSLRPVRIQDALQVLKTNIPANSRIFLVGESEGAYIAPDVALMDERVTRMALLSGGTRSWIDEEVMKAPPGQRAEIARFLKNEVASSPDLDRFYEGWPYGYLASYDTDATLKNLNQLDIPILALHGSEDRVIWLDATLADWKSLVEKMPGKRFSEVLDGQGHGVDGDQVCESLLRFVAHK